MSNQDFIDIEHSYNGLTPSGNGIFTECVNPSGMGWGGEGTPQCGVGEFFTLGDLPDTVRLLRCFSNRFETGQNILLTNGFELVNEGQHIYTRLTIEGKIISSISFDRLEKITSLVNQRLDSNFSESEIGEELSCDWDNLERHIKWLKTESVEDIADWLVNIFNSKNVDTSY